MDIQFLFSKDSKEFQKRHASVVGSDTRRQNLETELKKLKNHDGYYFKKFLKETYCTDSGQAANALIAQIVDFPNTNLPAQPCQSLTEFESKVVSELKNEISKKVDLQYLAPQSFEKVDNLAKHFKSEMLILWRSPKVSTIDNSNTLQKFRVCAR